MFVYRKKKNTLWSQKKNNSIVSTSSKPFFRLVDGRVTEKTKNKTNKMSHVLLA